MKTYAMMEQALFVPFFVPTLTEMKFVFGNDGVVIFWNTIVTMERVTAMCIKYEQ